MGNEIMKQISRDMAVRMGVEAKLLGLDKAFARVLDRFIANINSRNTYLNWAGIEPIYTVPQYQVWSHWCVHLGIDDGLKAMDWSNDLEKCIAINKLIKLMRRCLNNKHCNHGQDEMTIILWEARAKNWAREYCNQLTVESLELRNDDQSTA